MRSPNFRRGDCCPFGSSDTSQPSAAREKRVLVETYPYTDNDGGLIYEVCRFQIKLPDGSWAKTKDGKGTWKTFLQRRPSGLPDGSKIWGLRAGDYIRPEPGKDWSPWDQEKADKWPDHETRWFDGVEHTIYRHPEVEIAIAEGRPIFITEGEKDAKNTKEKGGITATTNSSGSKHWNSSHAANFREADVIIALDNDEAGNRAEALAKSMKGIARRIRVLDFAEHVPNFPAKHDISDWFDAGGTAEELQRIIDSLPDWKPKPPASKFGAVAVKDAAKLAKNHEWLVHNMIELKGTCAFAGYSQSGKSFLMIELAFCIALGKPFWGRDVKQGLVIYQLGEGETGFMKRLEGYMRDRGVDDRGSVPLMILPHKINLFSSDDDTNTLIAEAKSWREYYDMPLRLLVIDTYNKATRGANEISGQDIGAINDRVERLAKALECTVIVIDHLSKGGTMRGHGSKTDDFTNTIRVELTERTDRNGRKIRRMILNKNKEEENGQTLPFVLRQVVAGTDNLDRPVTTCVVEMPDGDDEELTRTGRLSPNQSLVLQTLRDVISREGEPPPVGVTGCPKGRLVVSWKTFMTELRKKWVFQAPPSEPEKRERELQRVVADAGKKLQFHQFIDRDNERGLREGEKGIIWWTGKEDRVFVKQPPEPSPAPELPPEIKQELAGAGDDCPF
jgi:hypothetical protein